MKKVLVLVLALAMVLGCTAAMADKIGYTCMDGTNPFFVALEGSIREVVEANGDELISLDPQNSNEKQLALVEDLISQGIVAIFINPVDRDGITPALDALQAANIPMFGFDTEVTDMDKLVTYAGSDNYNAGYVCGVDLVEKCPDGGPIIVLDSPTMQSVVDRTDGFLAAIEGHGFEVVAQIDCMGNQEQGNLNGTDALTAHPDAVAIFGGNDPTALGAAAAADAALTPRRKTALRRLYHAQIPADPDAVPYLSAAARPRACRNGRNQRNRVCGRRQRNPQGGRAHSRRRGGDAV